MRTNYYGWAAFFMLLSAAILALACVATVRNAPKHRYGTGVAYRSGLMISVRPFDAGGEIEVVPDDATAPYASIIGRDTDGDGSFDAKLVCRKPQPNAPCVIPELVESNMIDTVLGIGREEAYRARLIT